MLVEDIFISGDLFILNIYIYIYIYIYNHQLYKILKIIQFLLYNIRWQRRNLTFDKLLEKVVLI